MLNNPPPIEQEFPKFPKIYNWYMTKRQERFGVKLNINQIVDSYLKIPYTNIGRNDACPCQSGKKFKHCCINKF